MSLSLFADSLTLFAQARPNNGGDAVAAGGLGFICVGVPLIVGFVLSLAMVIGLWKVFEKAGQPGWAALVPFYNSYILIIEICKMDMIMFILSFVPFANLVPAFLAPIELAKKFGKEPIYGFGLIFLPMIFYPMLGFGDAQYERGKKKKKKKKRRPIEDEYDDDDDYDDRYDDDEDDFDDRPRTRRRRR